MLNISKGKAPQPHLLIVYGVDGIGKTSFASEFPDPVFVGAESGTNNLDVARFNKIKTIDDVINAGNELMTEKHSFKTVVFDSLDWIEPLIYEKLKKKYGTDQIEEVGGGYGKWVNIVLSEWKSFIFQVNLLRESGMNVIMISHYHVKPFNDPSSSEPYDRYSMKLNDKSAALLREFVDCVLFMNYETFVKKDRGMSKAKAFSDGTRYIYTTKTAAFDAKNRFDLPEKFEYVKGSGYNNYSQLIKGVDSSGITKEISLLLEKADDDIKKRVTSAIEKSNNNYSTLLGIKNKLEEILNGGN